MAKAKKDSESTAISNVDKELAMEISRAGGMTGKQAQLPYMRVEHTTDFNGDPNPMKGHFTFSMPNVLGEWLSTDM